jgi:hypothetical protein
VLPGGAPDEARVDEDRWLDAVGSFDRDTTARPAAAAESG